MNTKTITLVTTADIDQAASDISRRSYIGQLLSITYVYTDKLGNHSYRVEYIPVERNNR